MKLHVLHLYKKVNLTTDLNSIKKTDIVYKRNEESLDYLRFSSTAGVPS